MEKRRDSSQTPAFSAARKDARREIQGVAQPVPDVDGWIQPSGKVGGWSPRAQFLSLPRGSQGNGNCFLSMGTAVWSQHEGPALPQQDEVHSGQRTGRDSH